VVSSTPRDAPPPVWPALRRPGGGKLVYLDQKHWVHLAQAETGHPDGICYAAALEAARAAGTAVFPVSMCTTARRCSSVSPAHVRGIVERCQSRKLSGMPRSRADVMERFPIA
jgi:hypothetical protein